MAIAREIKVGCGMVIAGLVLVSTCVGVMAGSATEETEEDRARAEVRDAWLMCRMFVKQGLKSPASAQFGSSGEQPIEKTIRPLVKKGEYRCTGWVDAQNTFGAMLRNDFQLTLRKEPGDNDQWGLLTGPSITGR